MSKRGSLSTRTMVDFKSTPLEPLAFKARVVQLVTPPWVCSAKINGDPWKAVHAGASDP
jgi:hypothetical protein